MRGCDTGCSYGISSKYGGSLMHRRCERCGSVEIDLRDGALGVMALIEPVYEPFLVDLDVHQHRGGALN